MKAYTPAAPSYVDFEPNSELKEEEGVNTLIIHLPGFRKDQLRVQVSSTGVLKVSGEKPENGDGRIRRRFLKETKVPEGCNVNEIRAKFTADSELHITMLKKAAPAPPVQLEHQEPAKAEATPGPKDQNNKGEQVPPKPEVSQTEKAETPVPEDSQTEKPETPMPEDQKPDTSGYQGQLRHQVVGLGSTLTGLQSRKKAVVGLGLAMVAMVAIGAFVAYKYGSLSSSSDSYMDE